ncbi:MAG: PQQ-binding-like beta-propeller repeat protein [Phycisphaerae bacterium]|nr:PQQ-binding-like beta-propeller repeat protein [Saprospiraceae bacterium]
MNFIRILIFFSLLVTTQASAQGFLRSYAPDSASVREVLQTTDGGYFAVGHVADDSSVFLLKTDAVGQTLWSKQRSLNGAKAIATCLAADGSLVVLADKYNDLGTQKNALLKVDATTGDMVWVTVVVNNSFPNGLRDIVALPDGSFIAAGNTFDPSFSVKNQLIKIAPDGTILWQKIFGAITRNIRRLVLLPTGNVAVVGHGDDLYLAQLSPDGDLIWEQSYPEPESQTCYDVLATADGNIAMLGTSPSSSTNGVTVLNICVLKTDLDGNKLWFKNHYPFPTPLPNGTPKLPVLNGFAQDDAGNFYIPFWGYLDDPFDSNLEILKLAPDGAALLKCVLSVSGNAWHIIPTADHYFVVAGDNNGVPTNAMLLKVDSEGEYLNNRITGNVFRDIDVDCAVSPGETGLPYVIVKAENQSGEAFFKIANPDGSYEIRVSEGDFDLTVRRVYGPANAYFVCDTPSVTLNGTLQSVAAPPIGMQVLAECPLLDVDISGGLLRTCNNTSYTVNWCNVGNLATDNASMQVTVDTALAFLNSTLPLASQNGNVYSFDIGNVLPGACGTMYLQFKVSCWAAAGDVFCAEAHIFPDTTCALSDPNLDGSKIEVTGVCTGSEIEFKIKNTGTGNMTQVADYVIIEDQIMYMQAPLQLNAGEEMTTIRVPMPDDSCFALRVFPNQTTIMSKPVAVVANCTSNGNLSLLLSLPNNENDLAIATFCAPIIGSFDPNEKIGLPLGLTPAHYLERGDDIEYTIRFQNTGNDTAFLVVLRDELPATLDPASIRPIAASHAYTWDVAGNGLLSFTFPNILLPDSTTNEPESHGFVSFRISQKPNLPDGTLILNNASIYFDFNDAVVTNTWLHTIGRPVTVATKDPNGGTQNVEVLISPNPMAEEAVFALQGYLPEKPLRFALIDPLGKTLREEGFAGSEFLFKKQNMPAGLYFWQINEGGKTLARGRVVVE